MKKAVFIFLVCLCILSAQAKQKTNPRLIVRGDDMCSSQSGNRANTEAHKNGIKTTIELSYNDAAKALPRSTPEAEHVTTEGISNYLKAVKESGQDLHSVMIVRHGKVVAEQWFGDHAADKSHVMHSVSKTFTATAIGFCVAENRLKVTDKVISFFPNDLPRPPFFITLISVQCKDWSRSLLRTSCSLSASIVFFTVRPLLSIAV